MSFSKGHKFAKGRIKGSKNNPDLNSLRILLQESFHSNRVIIKNMLESMFTDMREQIKAINDKIVALEIHSTNYLSDYRYYTQMRSNLLEDFKWIMNLKASLEPKNLAVEHSGTIEGTELHITMVTNNNKDEKSELHNNATTNRSTQVPN